MRALWCAGVPRFDAGDFMSRVGDGTAETRSVSHATHATHASAARTAVDGVEGGPTSEAAESLADESGGAVCVVVLELPLRGGETAHYARCGGGAWQLRRPVRGGEARISLHEHSSAESEIPRDLSFFCFPPSLCTVPTMA